VLSAGDAVTCLPCPVGGNCTAAVPGAVVTLDDIVSVPGWWASPSSDGSAFYLCRVHAACLPGSRANGTRSRCSDGYTGALCDTCVRGFYTRLGECEPCPASRGGAAGVTTSVLIALAALAAAVCIAHTWLRGDVVMVGVSVMQIVAATSVSYSLPWPACFRELALALRWSLLDFVAATPITCASPVGFYSAFVTTLLGAKVALLLLAGVPWLVLRLGYSACAVRAVRRLLPSYGSHVVPLLPRHRGRLKWYAARRLGSSDSDADGGGHAGPGTRKRRELPWSVAVYWPLALRRCLVLASFLYAGVCLKVFQLFSCVRVEGTWLLIADVQQQCFTRAWAGYAVYALGMCVLFVVGVPLLAVHTRWRERRAPAANDSAASLPAHGAFDGDVDVSHRGALCRRVARAAASLARTSHVQTLYSWYGAAVWWWEAEELCRRLLLCALIVVLDHATVLQASLALIVCVVAHVLHAAWKPWGTGSGAYYLQHASLFFVSFVFLVALLFKSGSVSTASSWFHALSSLLCALFALVMLGWLLCLLAAAIARLLQHCGTKRVSPLHHNAPTPRVAVVDGDAHALSHVVVDTTPPSLAPEPTPSPRPPSPPLVSCVGHYATASDVRRLSSTDATRSPPPSAQARVRPPLRLSVAQCVSRVLVEPAESEHSTKTLASADSESLTLWTTAGEAVLQLPTVLADEGVQCDGVSPFFVPSDVPARSPTPSSQPGPLALARDSIDVEWEQILSDTEHGDNALPAVFADWQLPPVPAIESPVTAIAALAAPRDVGCGTDPVVLTAVSAVLDVYVQPAPAPVRAPEVVEPPPLALEVCIVDALPVDRDLSVSTVEHVAIASTYVREPPESPALSDCVVACVTPPLSDDLQLDELENCFGLHSLGGSSFGDGVGVAAAARPVTSPSLGSRAGGSRAGSRESRRQGLCESWGDDIGVTVLRCSPPPSTRPWIPNGGPLDFNRTYGPHRAVVPSPMWVPAVSPSVLFQLPPSPSRELRDGSSGGVVSPAALRVDVPGASPPGLVAPSPVAASAQQRRTP
jgi:hypothetical protein